MKTKKTPGNKQGPGLSASGPAQQDKTTPPSAGDAPAKGEKPFKSITLEDIQEVMTLEEMEVFAEGCRKHVEVEFDDTTVIDFSGLFPKPRNN